jgi:uncharacterized membrane protein
MRSLRTVSRPGFTRANCQGFCPLINCYSGPGARQEVRRIAFVREHVRHHGRFYLSALLGAIVWAVTGMLAQPLRFLVAGDAFFGVYLALTMTLEIGVTPETLRTRATAADEGIILIVVITLTAICFSLASIFALLNQNDKPDAARLVLAIVSVPLGWLMLHTIAAFHYAHLYYARAALGGLKRQRGRSQIP